MHLIYGCFFSLIVLLTIKKVYSTEGMPQFNTFSFPSQLFWLILSFSILYIFITFVVLPRLRSNIRLRKNKISNDLERADTIRNETEKIISEYNDRIEASKDKANILIKNTLKKTADDFNNQVIELRHQNEKRIKKAENELLLYKKNIENEINLSVNSISDEILEKVLNGSLNNKSLKTSIQRSEK
tara:strand:+ start:572 stop:1129 length:558 start_codon:yes stop_codon:yes gene_type:complete